MNANCTACKGNHEGSCEHGAFEPCSECGKYKCPNVTPRCVECCRRIEKWDSYNPQCPMGWTVGEKETSTTSASSETQCQTQDSCRHGTLTRCPKCMKLKCLKIYYCVECYRVEGQIPSYTFDCPSAYTHPSEGEAVKSTT